MKNTSLLTITSYTFFFLTGFFINIGGAITNTLADTLGVTSAAIGYCFSGFMIGRLLGISGNGILLKKQWINKDIYIRSIPLLGLLTIIALLFIQSITMFAVLIFLAGITAGGYYSTSNMILVDIYTGPKKAFHISIINFLFSVGGVTSPFLSGLLITKGYPWTAPYTIAGVLIVIILIITSTTRYSAIFNTPELQKENKVKIKIEPALWKICGAIVFYIFAEYSITYWTPIYMREALGKDALFAGSVVSAFWVAVLIGRFTASMLISRIQPLKFIIGAGLLSIFSILILTQLQNEVLILLFSFITGLSCAGLFPALFTFGTDRAEHIKHTFPTLMMLSAGSGSFLSMPAGSLLKSAIGINAIIFSPAVAIAIMTILAISVGARRSHKG